MNECGSATKNMYIYEVLQG